MVIHIGPRAFKLWFQTWCCLWISEQDNSKMMTFSDSLHGIIELKKKWWKHESLKNFNIQKLLEIRSFSLVSWQIWRIQWPYIFLIPDIRIVLALKKLTFTGDVTQLISSSEVRESSQRQKIREITSTHSSTCMQHRAVIHELFFSRSFFSPWNRL